MSFTKLDYCQYLLSSHIYYTLTDLAEITFKSGATTPLNRYLKGEKLTPACSSSRSSHCLSPTRRRST
jgi:hypothetical protein